ncbi:MAG: response regulator transcription factor [Rubrivivax sp.]|nr:response regulator transcription factor [Rubrivivax sp.]
MPSIDIRNPTPSSQAGLSQDRVMSALAAIDGIRSARDAAECLERLFQVTQAIDATASLYTVAIPEKGPEMSSITLFACDPGFAQQLFDPGPVQSHPWVRFARTHTTPGTGRQVQVRGPSDAAAIDVARAHGFGSYLIVPTVAGAELGRIELLCLGKGVHDSFESEDQRIVRMLAGSLAAELHDWFTLHLRAALQQAARLQAQDVQLLALEWEGLGTKEISLRTGMSVAAVDSRFQRLNQRLNCPSRKASARRAAEHGLLGAARHCAAPVSPLSAR